jgi:hypothetical protein
VTLAEGERIRAQSGNAIGAVSSEYYAHIRAYRIA